MLAAVLCYLGAVYAGAVASGARVGVVKLRNAVGAPARWNCTGACKACGARTSVLGVEHSTSGYITGAPIEHRWCNVLVTEDGRGYLIDNGRTVVPCRGCGRGRYAVRVIGKYAEGKECNAKCEAACGPTCECRCAGKNHGASVSL